MWQLSFLDSAFLWGSVLVAIPLVLHLVMRRQPRHLEFPALRFIQLRETANRRQMKLRHWLLLALRMAFILLLALALARPTLQGSGWLGDQEAPVATALVFDTNPRMEYRHQNQTRLEVARDTALWLLPQLPRDSEVAVIDARYGSGVFAVDLGAARQRIERLGTSAVGSPVATSFVDALRLVGESTKQRKEVYVFTDLARSDWSSQATQSLKKQLAETLGVGLYVIDVGVEQPQNFGIASLRLSNEAVAKGVPIAIQVELVHTGPHGERTVELFLADDPAKPDKRSQQTVELGADESAQIDLSLSGLAPGVHQGYVKIAGADALAEDDIRYFTVEVTPAWKILLAHPKSTKDRDYALFLSEALAPYALRLKGEARFQCDTVELNDLLKKPLNDYAVVCLLDPTSLADDVWRQLTDYTTGGGGVAIFLGRNANVDSFNQPAAQQLLPGKLKIQGRAPDEDYLAPESFEHPLLANLRPWQSSIPWDALPVYKYWIFSGLETGASVVIPYSNTLPALIEKPVGHGRTMTLTTPVSDSANDEQGWNRLPTGEETWPFVALVQEMMSYLAGSSHSKLNYLAGETAVIRLGSDQRHNIFSLTPPQGDAMRQAVDERQNALVVTSTEQVGNYRLRAGGDDEGASFGFSVNFSPQTSQLARATPDELKGLFGDIPYRIARNREEIVRDVNFGRVGRELYPTLMVLLMLALIAEQLLANRFYRSGAQAKGSILAGFKKDAAAATKSDSEPEMVVTP